MRNGQRATNISILKRRVYSDYHIWPRRIGEQVLTLNVPYGGIVLGLTWAPAHAFTKG
jgi:hypothetical protein